MSRGMRGRLERVAELLPAKKPRGLLEILCERMPLRRTAFAQQHVPADYRHAIIAKYVTPYTAFGVAAFDDWMRQPFASWAPPMPADYVLPVALCEFVATTTRDFSFLHGCTTCGLLVPIVFAGPGEPSPPPDIRPFPLCPACGGVTAYHCPPPTAEVCDGIA